VSSASHTTQQQQRLCTERSSVTAFPPDRQFARRQAQAESGAHIAPRRAESSRRTTRASGERRSEKRAARRQIHARFGESGVVMGRRIQFRRAPVRSRGVSAPAGRATSRGHTSAPSRCCGGSITPAHSNQRWCSRGRRNCHLGSPVRTSSHCRPSSLTISSPTCSTTNPREATTLCSDPMAESGATGA